MEENSTDQLFVLTSIEEETGGKPVERGLRDALKKSAIKAVSVSALKENMDRFFNQLREILDTGKDKIGEFEIDEVEVSAQITAGGEVCLLGSGVKVETEGGLKFVLKRSKQS
jgi:hypothetical protein